MTVPAGVNGLPVNMSYPDQTYGSSRVGMLMTAPELNVLAGLSFDEQGVISRLTSQILSQRVSLELRDAYYRGTIRIQDLGISIPPQMRQLKVALGSGWSHGSRRPATQGRPAATGSVTSAGR